MASPPPPAGAPQPTLRVMRLYKPKLHSTHVNNLAGPRLTQALALPDSFGDIYRGERFSAYVSVLNADGDGAAAQLRDVVVSAKLQAPSAKRAVELADTSEERRASAPHATGATMKRKANPAFLLETGENVDLIVEHTLEELGTHTLRVSVAYRAAVSADDSSPATLEVRSLRKFYRFNVLEPIAVEANAVRLPRSSLSDAAGRGELKDEPALGAVQVTLRNAMHARCVIETVTLHPPSGFSAREVVVSDGAARELRGSKLDESPPAPDEHVDAAATDETVSDAELELLYDVDALALYDAKYHVDPGESVRRVFTVHRAARASEFLTGDGSPPLDADDFPPRDAGWLRVAWRSAMGEGGAIATPAVQWVKAPHAGETDKSPTAQAADENAQPKIVDVQLRDLPPRRILHLGVVTTVMCVIFNRSDRDLSLQLQWRLDGMPSGVAVDGDAFQSLGVVKAKTSVSRLVRLLPLQAGLFSLTGCAVVDLTSAMEFPQSALADVLVER
ncbi:hypothetical protein M885DRAFT_505359 [Pelagophyceae sp. CCMP2097]|nr:hypothetical protein M885DRAFT_505359 [Pelagophyceae sp. CCMP2097]|mmetsp:Transcript_18290/g.61686  ORF Transcript_18290/g.61686 Transcript_18290/m.61686 type:complete len:504 (+) Transcript_18290:94-1605(+)